MQLPGFIDAHGIEPSVRAAARAEVIGPRATVPDIESNTSSERCAFVARERRGDGCLLASYIPDCGAHRRRAFDRFGLRASCGANGAGRGRASGGVQFIYAAVSQNAVLILSRTSKTGGAEVGRGDDRAAEASALA